MSFGKRLREARQKRHLSQAALAKVLGVSLQSVGRWEREETVPQAHYRIQLSHFFGLTPDILFADLTPSALSSASPALWSVPSPRNPYFTGREEVLQSIHQILHQPCPDAIPQALAISGLAGVGKTQVALEYAYRFSSTYKAIFWLQAETYDILVSDLARLSQFLQIPQFPDRDDRYLLKRIKHWLGQHTQWLLVLDNLADFSLLMQLDLPSANGTVLVTTRSQFTGKLAHRLDLQEMPEEEGSLLLLHRAKVLAVDQPLDAVSAETQRLTREISHVLGGLPLALDQAGAYIEESGCSLADYLQRYKQQRRYVLKQRGVLGGDHPNSMMETLKLSFEQLEHRSPAAAEVLRLCAFLHPDDIPEELIHAGLPYLGKPLDDNGYQLDQAFIALRSLSLVARQPETHSLRIHSLVQAVLRESMEPSVTRLWMERAVRTVNAVFPDEENAHWPQYDRYIPHVRACQHLIEEAGLSFPEAVLLLQKAGSYMLKRGRAEEAKHFLSQALAIQQTLYGPDSPEYAKTCKRLATLSGQVYTGFNRRVRPTLRCLPRNP